MSRFNIPKGVTVSTGWKVPTVLGAVTAAAPLALDNLTVQAAYSFRKLRTAYAGSAVRIRESGGSTEADIGFVGNDFDTAAAATHIGGGSGLIVTWYDQSGNGRDATNATTTQQPLYVASGQNSKPTMRFDATDTNLATAAFISFPSKRGALVAVCEASAISGGAQVGSILNTFGAGGTTWSWYGSDHATFRPFSYFDGSTTQRADADASLSGFQLLMLNRTGDTSLLCYRNAALGATLTIANNQPSELAMFIGTNAAIGEPYDQDMAEIYVVGAVLTDGERTALETNINAYWAVY